jgi:hypothetical protein
MAGKIEETEPELSAANEVTCPSILKRRTQRTVKWCAYAHATVTGGLLVSLVAAEGIGSRTIVAISYPEETRQRDLTIEIQGYNVEYHATAYEEESLKSLPLTSTERMARERLTLSACSEGQYASAQRQRLTKWRNNSGRK